MEIMESWRVGEYGGLAAKDGYEKPLRNLVPKGTSKGRGPATRLPEDSVSWI